MKYTTLKNIGFVLLLTLSQKLFATNYYVSSSVGNDNNSGQSESLPVKTIAGLVTKNLADNDNVYFKRGDKFIGQVDMHRSFITYDAYGTGVAPIIRGAEPVAGWKKYKDNIYVADYTKSIKNLYINKKQGIFARFPNQGFLYLTNPDGNKGFIATQAQPSWQGANVRIRTTDFTWETKKISLPEPSKVAFESSTDYSPDNERAFYVDNKLEFLDQPNEWFFDDVNKKLYFIPDANTDINTLEVDAVVYEYGFKGDYNLKNITIQNLQIDGYSIDGIWIFGAGVANTTIANNKIYRIWEKGVTIMGENNTIKNNLFDDCGNGIFAYAMNNSLIENNGVVNISLIHGYGATSTNAASGIVTDNCDKVTIRGNVLNKIGNNGIRFNISNGLVEKNIVRSAQLTHADGGGIYCWSAKANGNTVQNNFVYDTYGEKNGKPEGITNGIYIDNDAYNNLIINNTIAESSDGGILINANAHSNIVTKNTVYGCKGGQLCLADWADKRIRDNRISQNIFYSLLSTSTSVLLLSNYGFDGLATYDSNFYLNPYSKIVVEKRWKENAKLDLVSWQAISKEDANTKKSPYDWNACEQSGSNCAAPKERAILLVNETNADKVVPLTDAVYFDLNNKKITSITIPAYYSKIVIKGDNPLALQHAESFDSSTNDLIYPNPATDKLYLTGNSTENATYEITTIEGKALQSGAVSGGNINIGNLKTGIYIIKIKTDAGDRVMRFVKE